VRLFSKHLKVESEENGRDCKERVKNGEMGTHSDMSESNFSMKNDVDLGRQHQNQIKEKEETPKFPTCICLNTQKLAHLTTFSTWLHGVFSQQTTNCMDLYDTLFLILLIT